MMDTRTEATVMLDMDTMGIIHPRDLKDPLGHRDLTAVMVLLWSLRTTPATDMTGDHHQDMMDVARLQGDRRHGEIA